MVSGQRHNTQMRVGTEHRKLRLSASLLAPNSDTHSLLYQLGFQNTSSQFVYFKQEMGEFLSE